MVDNFFLKNDPQFSTGAAPEAAAPTNNFFLVNDPQFKGQMPTTERVQRAVAEKYQTGQKIINSSDNPASKGVQYVGQVGARLANEGIDAEIPQAVKSVVGKGVDLLNQGAEKISPYIPGQEDFNSLTNTAADWTLKKHPEAARNIAAVGEVAKLAGTMIGAGDVANVARAGINSASDAMANIKPKAASAASAASDLPLSKSLFSEGDKAFADANKSGAGGTEQAVNNFLSQANATAAQDPILLRTHGPDDVQKYLQNLSALQDQPLPISAAQKFDIDLRERASKAFRAGDNSLGARYKAIRQSLRDHIYNNQDPSMITGGAEGFQALQEGNRLYHQGYKAEEIEGMMQDAAAKGNTPTVIKNQFAKLAKDIRENGKQGWTDQQISLINHAAETGSMTGLLSAMGNKLVSPTVGGIVAGTAGATIGGPLGAAVGGTLGSGAGYIAGAPFRTAASALQRARAEAVLNSIADNPTYAGVKAAPKAAPLALPAPGKGAGFYVDSLGNISRTPNPAHEIVAGRGPAEISGVPADPAQAAQMPAGNLGLPNPADYEGITSDALGNVVRGAPSEQGFKTIQELMQGPLTAEKIAKIKAIRSKK